HRRQTSKPHGQRQRQKPPAPAAHRTSAAAARSAPPSGKAHTVNQVLPALLSDPVIPFAGNWPSISDSTSRRCPRTSRRHRHASTPANPADGGTSSTDVTSNGCLPTCGNV